jgi:hypothetical protein
MANGNSSSGTKFQTILLFLIIFLVAGGIIYYYYNEKKQSKNPSSTTYIVPVPGVPSHVIGGCAGTRYGCCPDGRTARADMRGSNC